MSKNALVPNLCTIIDHVASHISLCCGVRRFEPNHNKYRIYFLKSAKSLIKIQFRSPIQSPLPKYVLLLYVTFNRVYTTVINLLTFLKRQYNYI